MTRRKGFYTSSLFLAAGFGAWLSWPPARPVNAAPQEDIHSAGVKITFGVRNPTHGRIWSGGVRNPAQVRSIQGWHFGSNDSIVANSQWNITLENVGGDVAAKAVILDLRSPESQPVTVFSRYGDFSFVPSELAYGAVQPVKMTNGDVTVERVPLSHVSTAPDTEDDDPAMIRTRNGEYWLAWVSYKTRQRSGYQYTGGDQVMAAHGRDGVHWSAPMVVSPAGDHFRVALGEDARGGIRCVYAEQKRMETGNFDLFARRYEGGRWSTEEQLTTSPMPDAFHRMTSDGKGNLYLTWMGYREGSGGGLPQSEILLRVLTGDRWSEEINVSQSAADDWEPSISVDRSGRAWIAWDSYRSTGGEPASYDVLLRSYTSNGLGPVRTVSATRFAEMHADVKVDGQDRVWIAWEEGGVNWGKDTGYENPRNKIWLRPGGSHIYGPPNSQTALYRRPRLAVLENEQLRQPKAHLEASLPETMQKNLYMSPRLGLDGSGRVWLFLRHQLVAQGRNGGQMFDYYATTLAGGAADQHWMPPVLIPSSTGRQDTVLASAPAEVGLVAAVVGDGRHFPVPLPINHDVSTLLLDARASAADPQFEAFQPSPVGDVPVTHPQEAQQVADIRSHRTTAGAGNYKIVRGDLHRHTEISMDGAIDGSLWDLYRYALNAAALDFVAVTDHNYGAWLDTDEPESKNTDDEYQWWRTQKSADLFYVPGRFVPLYGYERSVNFPRGHRNIFHVRRGVFSYRVPKLFLNERPELIDKDAQGLWAYLRGTNGIGLPHSTGTNMGTDWRHRNDELEPVAELYSGDWGGFEALGQPRAATKDAMGGGFSGRPPYVNGLIWNALGVGYKMGFIASSDHWATHIAYANLLVPDHNTTRADIQEALRQRHTYASTDNIILDFAANDVLQGSDLRASQSPTFRIRVQGTEPILRLEVVKNNRIVFTQAPAAGAADARVMEFTYRDNEKFADTSVEATDQISNWSNPETGIRPRPAGKMAYYYVRVIERFSREMPEREGETAWSSPIFVRQ